MIEITCTCDCHDNPAVMHFSPCCEHCGIQRQPDRPPPALDSPFAWEWDDRPNPPTAYSCDLGILPKSNYFDLSDVYVPADRVAWGNRDAEQA